MAQNIQSTWLLLLEKSSGLPKLSQILNIIVMSGKLYFVAEGRLSWFCDHIRGYIIETTGQVQIIELSSLLDY